MTDRDVTIILADDHAIVRQALARLLEGEPRFHVIGEADNGQEAIRKVKEVRPDVVIMDISMPILNGIEATRQIKQIRPKTKVIILSMHCHDRYTSELFRLGISGYLLKDSTGSDIVKAVQAVMEGETYMSPSASRVVTGNHVSIQKKSFREELYSTLSNREREVFRMIAEGHSNREISEILSIDPYTVKTHGSKIMEKLRIEDISQLVQFAIGIGIVESHALPGKLEK